MHFYSPGGEPISKNMNSRCTAAKNSAKNVKSLWSVALYRPRWASSLPSTEL